MSIEFVDGMPQIDLGALLVGMLKETSVPESNWEPDPDRYVAVLDLFKDHQRRLDESHEDTESGMLTPRITMREHTDMHLLMTAFDKYMVEVTEEWYNATAAHGMGNNSETLETLTVRSREITEAAKLRHEMDRMHKRWAEANATAASEAHTEEFPDDYDSDRERWGDADPE